MIRLAKSVSLGFLFQVFLFQVFLFSVLLFPVAGQAWASPSPSDLQQASPADSTAAVVLPAGTKLELTVTNAVWARTAKAGDPLYTQTNFPVTVGDNVAVPAGTYVEGTIEAVTRPTRRVRRAEIRVLFTKIIFANGYAVLLPDYAGAEPGTPHPSAGRATGPAPTAATVTVQMSPANDLLLDNGAQAQMTLAAPLALDARRVVNAIALTRAPEPGKFKSATLCRPTAGSPGTPGSPDTVIAGSPGTPSTTIPATSGVPSITIPGTPATPDTVIPGMSGTAGTEGMSCPEPPMVISSAPFDMTAAQNPSIVPATTH